MREIAEAIQTAISAQEIVITPQDEFTLKLHTHEASEQPNCSMCFQPAVIIEEPLAFSVGRLNIVTILPQIWCDPCDYLKLIPEVVVEILTASQRYCETLHFYDEAIVFEEKMEIARKILF